MQAYIHKVQYYETDRMGITHHSNYIRFMEEARVDYLDQLGYPYAKLEELGLISPVTKAECQYKVPTTFGDEIRISVLIEELSMIKVRFRYKMMNQNSVLVATAASEHCFVSGEGKIIRIDKEYPEFFEALKKESDANSL